MKRLTQLCLAFLAISAVGIIASTTAFAENPLILPEPTMTSPLKVTTLTLETKVETVLGPPASVTCKKSTLEGEFTSGRLGTAVEESVECKSGSGEPCNTVGAPKETEIFTMEKLHLVAILLLEGLRLGIAATISGEVPLKCGSVLIKQRGTVIAEFLHLEPGAKVKGGELSATQTKGKQAIKECVLDKAFCEGNKYFLESNFGLGFEQSGALSTGTFTLAKEVTFDF